MTSSPRKLPKTVGEQIVHKLKETVRAVLLYAQRNYFTAAKGLGQHSIAQCKRARILAPSPLPSVQLSPYFAHGTRESFGARTKLARVYANVSRGLLQA